MKLWQNKNDHAAYGYLLRLGAVRLMARQTILFNTLIPQFLRKVVYTVLCQYIEGSLLSRESLAPRSILVLHLSYTD